MPTSLELCRISVSKRLLNSTLLTIYLFFVTQSKFLFSATPPCRAKKYASVFPTEICLDCSDSYIDLGVEQVGAIQKLMKEIGNRGTFMSAGCLTELLFWPCHGGAVVYL